MYKVKKKEIVAIIIAREGSSRLPGKAITEVNGKPMIGHIAQRLGECKLIKKVIIATSVRKEDDAIALLGKKMGIEVFRGHAEDVLDRLYHAVENIDADAIIEVGGDCPFVSPHLLEEGITHYLNNPDADFVSNALIPPYTYPDGYDFVLLSKTALKFLHENARFQSERYQPFQYVIKNKELFKIVRFEAEGNFNHWRWTLDYPEDLAFVKRIYSELYDLNPFFGFEEIRRLLAQKPDIIELNQMHAHNTLYSGAWYTGSYVLEMHTDIKNLLDSALELEGGKRFGEVKPVYEQIKKLVEDLVDRAITRETHG
jgi:spore coat polysaccharide biosynthesis protein SpsF